MLEIFQISAALLVSLTGICSAIVEGFPIAALTAPLALATWYFVDRMKWLRIPSWLPPCLGLAAFLAAGFEYLFVHESSHLYAGNHLLAYLTWIFLIQEKETQHYWWLFALSVLQIAVTALLTYSVWFGVALLAYTLLATWTLSIFLLYRSVKSLKEDDAGTESAPRKSTSATGIGHYWSGVSRDRHERLVTPRFFGSTLSVTGVALVIALLFFLFTPRIWPSPRYVEGGSPSSPLTGFSNEVRLGDMGEILESKEKVMEVRVFNSQTDTLLPTNSVRTYFGIEPLFRGSVLEVYQEGRWQRSGAKPSRRVAAHVDEATYRLRIDLAPLSSETLFSFGNMVGAKSVRQFGSISWDYFSNELERGEETDLEREFSYDLYTSPGSPDTWLFQQRLRELQAVIRYGMRGNITSPMSARRFGHYLESLTRIPDDLAALKPVALKVIGEETSTASAAQHLEDWFTTSGQFSYTLKLSKSTQSIDPILDFVMNRRQGHCEYFASAMAMMLRSIRIPSRVITGFKGGVLSPDSNTLTVQQLHAHAWVEAFIDGRWQTFDPTPGARDEVVENIESRPSKLVRLWRNAQTAWHRMAMLSRDSQKSQIYLPFVEKFKQTKTTIHDLLQGRTDRLKHLLKFLRTPERWISIEGGLLALIIMLLLSAIIWLIRRIYAASKSLSQLLGLHSGGAGGNYPRVPFYDRFIEILRRQGFTQQPSQTAKEFVEASLPQLQLVLSSHGLAQLPEVMVHQFYRVRFGRESLSQDEIHEMHQRLNELETCLETPVEPRS